MNVQKILLIIFLAFLPLVIFAANSNSTNFQVTDGGFSPSGYSSSPSFQLNSAVSQISIGPSASSNLNLKSGWLYFPVVSTPVVSATAGDSQVALSWTPAIGLLGWTVGGYSIGWSAVSGGPYTLISSDTSTNYTKTSLANSTPYYFVIKVKDGLGNFISTSTEVSATPVATVVTPPGGGGGSGGGGGGGGSTPPSAGGKVTFRGRAYPMSDVTLLRDGQFVAKTKSGPDANFEISVSDLGAGQYNFGINAVDILGNQSLTQTFPVTLTSSAGTSVGGIFIAPSIAVDKLEVKKGDNLAIFGRTVPSSEIVIAVNSENEIFAKTASDKSGAYLYNLDTVPLEFGDHTAKSKSAVKGEISPFGQSVAFKVGTQNILKQASAKPKCPAKGDLNGDCKVNLTDFSIAAYWYKRSISASFKPTEKEKLSGDGKVDLVDFSIIAYYWTG